MTGESPEPEPVDSQWPARAQALADGLEQSGAIHDPAWARVFAQVPRHPFVPCWWALDEFNRIDRPLRADDPVQRTEWLDGVYADRALITQWADGEFAGHSVRMPTSSASQPTVVATMLDRLDVADGHRVLEIGTGTGYNAALLAARLGDHRVHSIDIHPDLVAAARERLDARGYRPHLHTGDGAHPPGVNDGYDRIIATCAVPRIPAAWLGHLAPGGRVVAPLTFGSALAVLDRREDTSLTGHIDDQRVRFMPFRTTATEPTIAGTAPEPPTPDPAQTHHGVTDVDPAWLDDPDFAFWLALHRPDMIVTGTVPGTRATTKQIYTDVQTASVTPAEHDWTVRQQGGRPWDTVEAAARSFLREGRPSRTRILMTVRPDGSQFFSLSEDDGRNVWPLINSSPGSKI